MAKVGLVLEGGGMRGSYTLGILDVLLEEKLYFPYVIGVSAGACNAASYASRQAGRGQRIVERFLPDPRYLSFGNLLRRGHSMFGMDFIFDEIPAKYELYDYDTFYALGTRLVIGVTDVVTGKARYVENPPREVLNDYFRASSSIPLFSPIVALEGGLYLDGGTSDPIPFDEALRHCDKVVVVVTRPRDYVKSPAPALGLYRQLLRKYPNMVETVRVRHEVYNGQRQRLAELEKDGRALVFYPESMDVDVFEKKPERLHAVYEMGVSDAKNRMAELRTFLADADNLLDR